MAAYLWEDSLARNILECTNNYRPGSMLCQGREGHIAVRSYCGRVLDPQMLREQGDASSSNAEHLAASVTQAWRDLVVRR